MTRRTQALLLWTGLAVAAQSIILAATLSHSIFLGAVGPGVLEADTGLYFQYASRTLSGEIPYRDFLVEYPPLAMPLFLLARLVSGDSFSGFLLAFGVEMMLFNALAVFLVARRVADREALRQVPRRLAWYTAAFGALCPLLIGRYDLAPMTLCFAAACLWFSGRPLSGGAIAAAGTLMKIFPGVIAAPALAWEAAQARGRRGWGLVSLGLCMAVGAAVWLAIGGPGVAASLKYHTGRGLELGSIYASGVLVGGLALDAPMQTALRAASIEIDSPWSVPLSQLALPIQAAALLLVAWRYRQAPEGADPLRYAAASLLAFILFGKVLSPQYMVWLFPFIAILPGRHGTRIQALFLIACVLTTMVYPWAFHRIMRFETWAVGLLVYRNLLLLGLWIYLLVDPVTVPATAGNRATKGGAAVASLLSRG